MQPQLCEGTSVPKLEVAYGLGVRWQGLCTAHASAATQAFYAQLLCMCPAHRSVRASYSQPCAGALRCCLSWSDGHLRDRARNTREQQMSLHACAGLGLQGAASRTQLVRDHTQSGLKLLMLLQAADAALQGPAHNQACTCPCCCRLPK